MTSQLEMDFHRAMLGVYENIHIVAQYNATRFKRLVCSAGGLRAARCLLLHDRITDGLWVLHRANALEASMEKLVLQPRWQPLFTERERLVAASRLNQLRTKPRKSA